MLKNVALLAMALTLTLPALADTPSKRIETNPVAKHKAPKGKKPAHGTKGYHNGMEVPASKMGVEAPLNDWETQREEKISSDASPMTVEADVDFAGRSDAIVVRRVRPGLIAPITTPMPPA
jgi:hypothetical protein